MEYMRRSGLVFLTLIFLLIAAQAGCNFPGTGEPTPDSFATSAAETVAVRLTWAAIDSPPPPTLTQAIPTEEPTATTPPATPTMTTTPDEANCDRADFDADVTIPDDTTLDPSTDFTKTWRLINVGTCTWTTEYALVFVDGEQMDGAEAAPFTVTVAPNDTVELSVELTSPTSPGTYRGNWQLRNAEGRLFGIGDDADMPFWVQIVVGEVEDELGLGTPDWRDPMNSSTNWFMVDTDDTRFEVKDGNLVMESINSGAIDEWGLSVRPKAKDFYLEITATTGDTCSGLDRYGVVIRAQDPNELYVYGFSCNGRYRLYKWDGEYTAIKEWTSSSHILAGPDQTNQLGIWAEGDTFKLYANRKLLAEVTDSTYSEGRFGLFVGSAQTDGFQVFVDEVAFWVVGD